VPELAKTFGPWRRGWIDGPRWPGQVHYRRGPVEPLTAPHDRARHRARFAETRSTNQSVQLARARPPSGVRSLRRTIQQS